MHPQAVATHGLTVELLENEPDIHQVTDSCNTCSVTKCSTRFSATQRVTRSRSQPG
jgi:hypothetical protein